MTKTKEPKPSIEFVQLGPTMWRCQSESDATRFYNVAVVADESAMCCCKGAMRKGVNGCKHAKALVEQGLAKRPAYFCGDCCDTGIDLFDRLNGAAQPKRCSSCNGASATRELYR